MLQYYEAHRSRLLKHQIQALDARRVQSAHRFNAQDKTFGKVRRALYLGRRAGLGDSGQPFQRLGIDRRRQIQRGERVLVVTAIHA